MVAVAGRRNERPMTETPARTHQQSIIIETTPEAIYDLVSDITRTGEWSPVCTACWWDDVGEAGRDCCVARSGGEVDCCHVLVFGFGVCWFRFPPAVISVAVRWYLRYGLSYRDVEELLAERGVTVDHVTMYRWVQRFTPEFVEAARTCRHVPGDR